MTRRSAAAIAFGRRVRLVRLRRGFSLEAVAALIHAVPSRILRWERGAALPTPEQMIALSEVLGIEPQSLSGGGADFTQALASMGVVSSPEALLFQGQYPAATAAGFDQIAAAPFLDKPAVDVPTPSPPAVGARTPARAAPSQLSRPPAIAPHRHFYRQDFVPLSVGPCGGCGAAGVFLMRLCDRCWRGED